MDVRFDDFMADESGTVRGSTNSPANRSTTACEPPMGRFLDGHPRGRYGGVVYSLSDLGLDRAEVALELGDYHRRFVATGKQENR